VFFGHRTVVAPLLAAYMGVEGFGSYLRSIAPHVFKPFKPASLQGKSVAIDMNQQLYAFFRGCTSDVANTRAAVTAFARQLKEMKVFPICVFDGNTRGAKPRAHTSRAMARLSLQAKIINLEKAESTLAKMLESSPCAEAEQSRRASVSKHLSDTGAEEEVCLKPLASPASRSFSSIQAEAGRVATMLRASRQQEKHPESDLFSWVQCHWAQTFGAHAVIIADLDAEALAANLCASGIVDYAISTDYDTLVFGAPAVINRIQLRVTDADTDSKALYSHVLHLQEVLDAFGFTSRQQLVDFAILAGCDFCEKVRGVGVVTAHKWIKEFGSLEHAVIQHECNMRKKLWRPILPRLHADSPQVFSTKKITRARNEKLFDEESPAPPELQPVGAQYARQRYLNVDSGLRVYLK
jgi:5'-3' exonuclease